MGYNSGRVSCVSICGPIYPADIDKGLESALVLEERLAFVFSNVADVTLADE